MTRGRWGTRTPRSLCPCRSSLAEPEAKQVEKEINIGLLLKSVFIAAAYFATVKFFPPPLYFYIQIWARQILLVRLLSTNADSLEQNRSLKEEAPND